ncbi:hypothetical protein Q31b_49300 [Novipirellula aureliae]|nr:hypothetical protein Q31b_49300 [Novipirellula aureliae]
MPSMTKNSVTSQAVVWTGCLLTCLGLYLDHTGFLFSLGGTLFSFGMIQSYFGSVLEIQTAKRFPYILLGIPLSLGLFYCACLSLRELSAAYVVVAVMVLSAALQLIVSMLTARLWERRRSQNHLSAKTTR